MHHTKNDHVPNIIWYKFNQ